MWGKSRATPVEIPDHVRRRVDNLPTGDLPEWADQAVYTAGRYVTSYGRTGNDADLQEALLGAQVLMAVIERMSRGQ